MSVMSPVSMLVCSVVVCSVYVASCYAALNSNLATKLYGRWHGGGCSSISMSLLHLVLSYYTRYYYYYYTRLVDTYMMVPAAFYSTM